MLYVIDQVYSGLKYCPPHEANRKSTYSNAITDTLKECKRDKRYYIARFLRRFYDLNAKAYKMYQAGELSKSFYEKFHRQCMWVLEDYEVKFNATDEESA